MQASGEFGASDRGFPFSARLNRNQYKPKTDLIAMHQLSSAGRRKAVRIVPALLAAACTLHVLTGNAFGFYKPADDNSELFFVCTASIADNDNIFLSHNDAQSALIFDIVPGLSFESGKDTSVEQTKITASEDFQKYADGKSFTDELTNAELFSRYDDDKLKLSFDGSFHELDQPEIGLQNLDYLEERDVTTLNGTGEVQLTEKSSVGASVIYFNTSYRDAG